MSGRSSDSGAESPAVTEAMLAILCILGLVLGAALLPSFDAFAQSPAPGGSGGGGSGGGGGGDGGSARESGTSGGSGSPAGATLSTSAEVDVGGAITGRIPQIPLFVVTAPRTGYWRQTAYAFYTGSGWESRAEWQPFTGSVPNDRRTIDGEALQYRIRLLTAGSSLPTLWQPESVTVEDSAAALEVSTVGGFRSQPALSEGSTYTGRSATPVRDRDLLGTRADTYPEQLERRYTQLPEETPERVFEFTDQLTEDAETPYQTAVAVRDWLQTNKAYDLNASHEPGEPIADQFIFEMERGYCQYFATTMVVMLRTQGIPARYVVGFSGGERVAENRYLVTSDTGHAWVEVYFAEVGWVRFDPTPAGTLPLENPQPPYNISLNRSAVAGATVAVSVQKNGSAVSGAPVLVNGERVGWTGGDGTVTTRLPYVANVTITARPPGAVGKYSNATASARADGGRVSSRGGGTAPSAHSSRQYGRPVPRAALSQVARGDASSDNESSRTYHSETNVTITVTGNPVRGQRVVVRATIRDVPVRSGNVTLDGRPVGETNGDGEANVSLAGVTAGNHTLRVTRGGISEQVTVSVAPPPPPDEASNTTTADDAPAPINVSVSTPFGVPLPTRSATVTVTRAGRPVPGAAVTLGGGPAGRTGPNGSLALTLPLRRSVTVLATGPAGTTARTTLTGLYRNALLVVGLSLALLGGCAVWLRRRSVTPRRVYRTLAATAEAIVALARAALIRTVDALLGAARALRLVLGRLYMGLRHLPLALDPRRLVGLVRRWLASLRDWLRARVSREAGDSTGSAAGGDAAATPVDDTAAGRAPETVRELWREFVQVVRPPGLATRTPGEIAAYAIERGLPEQPVEALTELYRDAEYGHLSPDSSHLDAARSALNTIRESRTGEE